MRHTVDLLVIAIAALARWIPRHQLNHILDFRLKVASTLPQRGGGGSNLNPRITARLCVSEIDVSDRMQLHF